MLHLTLNKVCIPVSRRVGYKCRYVPLNMSNQRMHWALKHKWTDGWKQAVRDAVLANKKGIEQYHGVAKVIESMAIADGGVCARLPKVEIVFCTIRLMDYDGAYGAAKPVLDGLTECGLIKDDSPAHIDLQVKQIKVAHVVDQKVIINIIQ